MKDLTGEHRLWLSVLLLVLSERDERFVKIKHRSSARDAVTKRHIAEGARIFVDSEEFNTLCLVFDFDADELRLKTPEESWMAYQRVVNDDLEIEENNVS